MPQEICKEDFIGTTAYQVRISTFHSFCNEIIQTHADKFAVKRERKQITDLDKFRIIQKILDNFDPKKTYREFENLLSEIQYKKTLLRPFNDTYYYQKEIVDRIDDLKKENISSDEFAKLIKAQIGEVESQKKINKKTPKAVAMGRASKPTAKWMKEVERVQKNIELLQIYTEISRIYEEESLYDFTDMVLFVLKAFEEDENLLAYYQEKFLYILVDEYQDTNGAQNNLVKKLGSFDDSPNVFVVGDDDQSIYRFQGANLANILEFKNTFPNSEIITITQNYRSTQLILDAADSIISKNK